MDQLKIQMYLLHQVVFLRDMPFKYSSSAVDSFFWSDSTVWCPVHAKFLAKSSPCWCKNTVLHLSNWNLWHSSEQMMCFCDRLLLINWLKIQFNMAVIWYVLVHPFMNQFSLLCLNEISVKWINKQKEIWSWSRTKTVWILGIVI